MKLFIPRIPATTKKSDIKNFLLHALNKGFRLPFSQDAYINACEILRIKDSNGVIDYHGVISVEPESAAQRAMKRLTGRSLNGKRVVIRPYSERRQINHHFLGNNERRRKNIEISKLSSPVIEGLADFARIRG